MICPACAGVSARSVTLPPFTPSTSMFWKSSLAIARETPFPPWPLVVTQKST